MNHLSRSETQETFNTKMTRRCGGFDLSQGDKLSLGTVLGQIEIRTELEKQQEGLEETRCRMSRKPVNVRKMNSNGKDLCQRAWMKTELEKLARVGLLSQAAPFLSMEPRLISISSTPSIAAAFSIFTVIECHVQSWVCEWVILLHAQNHPSNTCFHSPFYQYFLFLFMFFSAPVHYLWVVFTVFGACCVLEWFSIWRLHLLFLFLSAILPSRKKPQGCQHKSGQTLGIQNHKLIKL